MDTSSYTIPYVTGWAGNVDGKAPVEVVQATGERVRKTAATILDGLDTVQIGNGDPPGLVRDTPATRTSSPVPEPVVESAADLPPESSPRRSPATAVRTL